MLKVRLFLSYAVVGIRLSPPYTLLVDFILLKTNFTMNLFNCYYQYAESLDWHEFFVTHPTHAPTQMTQKIVCKHVLTRLNSVSRVPRRRWASLRPAKTLFHTPTPRHSDRNLVQCEWHPLKQLPPRNHRSLPNNSTYSSWFRRRTFREMTFCKIQNLLKDLTKGLVFVKVRIRLAQIKKSANLLVFKSVTKHTLFKLF